MSEFNEPWIITRVVPRIEFEDDEVRFRVHDSKGGVMVDDLLPSEQSIADRIAACVNACRDIPTERLTDELDDAMWLTRNLDPCLLKRIVESIGPDTDQITIQLR